MFQVEKVKRDDFLSTTFDWIDYSYPKLKHPHIEEYLSFIIERYNSSQMYRATDTRSSLQLPMVSINLKARGKAYTLPLASDEHSRDNMSSSLRCKLSRSGELIGVHPRTMLRNITSPFIRIRLDNDGKDVSVVTAKTVGPIIEDAAIQDVDLNDFVNLQNNILAYIDMSAYDECLANCFRYRFRVLKIDHVVSAVAMYHRSLPTKTYNIRWLKFYSGVDMPDTILACFNTLLNDIFASAKTDGYAIVFPPSVNTGKLATVPMGQAFMPNWVLS